MDAVGIGLEPADPAGEVVNQLLAARSTDGLGVEDHQIGPVPRPHLSPVHEAQDGGRHRGELADALLERPLPEVQYPAPQEVGAVVRAVVPGQVGTAVGRADDHVRIVLGLLHRSHPCVGLGHPAELGPEVVGQSQVQHGIGRCHALLLGNVQHGTPDKVGELGILDEPTNRTSQ